MVLKLWPGWAGTPADWEQVLRTVPIASARPERCACGISASTPTFFPSLLPPTSFWLHRISAAATAAFATAGTRESKNWQTQSNHFKFSTKKFYRIRTAFCLLHSGPDPFSRFMGTAQFAAEPDGGSLRSACGDDASGRPPVAARRAAAASRTFARRFHLRMRGCGDRPAPRQDSGETGGGFVLSPSVPISKCEAAVCRVAAASPETGLGAWRFRAFTERPYLQMRGGGLSCGRRLTGDRVRRVAVSCFHRASLSPNARRRSVVWPPPHRRQG